MATAARQDGWDPSRSGAGSYSPWLIVGIISIPTFMEVLDTSIANVALPTIAGDMAASPATAIWIVNAYQLAITMTLLPLASVGDIYEYRRVYRIGLAVFTAASLACAL